ncbi:Glycosyltransferase like family 2 [Rhodovulum sp. ES.010]|uniref:glycosyltransferase family 2 protein n=1 Tax=Rhodovulum sp. ES.010 TaxID=1882821 RepID=UPI00092CAE41|nr:glycosyltransferase [Rhodovulum sp. ES.010]SIO59821.1 Glycosyltransferase like family 2 [Rhodovulum sp. ES.010]
MVPSEPPATGAAPGGTDGPRLNWSACIATLNRHDVLMVALAHLLRQSRPPAEIVVVDASDDWEAGRARAEALMRDRPGIRLDYITSPVRSSATQRNLAIGRAASDVVLMMDDDSFLHDDCAERLMEIYEADAAGEVAGIGATLVEDNPAAAASGEAPALGRKDTGRVALDRLARRALETRLGRWANRELLYQRADKLFMCYDEPRTRRVPAAVAHLDVAPAAFMPGSGMSMRRAIALKEPFDSALRYYAAFEDLDVAYRVAKHGSVLSARAARLHHFEAASGRIKRQKVITFQLLNMAVFLKRNAATPDAFLSAYRVMLWRRLLAEVLKDGLSRRWRFPQVAGVLTAMRHWREVWARDAAQIDAWYPDFQKRILDDIR